MSHLHSTYLCGVTAIKELQVVIFQLHYVTATKDNLVMHFTNFYTFQEDLEITHIVYVQGEPLRLWALDEILPEHVDFGDHCREAETLFFLL